MTEKTDVDLILPCYNPSAGWEKQVVSNLKQITSLFDHVCFHLYIANDGSIKGFEKEKTDYIYKEIPTATIVSYPNNQGKGYALRAAVKASTSPYIIYTDYDFPYTLDSFTKVLNTLLGGADIVIASRDKAYQRNLTLRRKILSYMSHVSNRILLNLKYLDLQGGLKGFNKSGKEIFLSTQIKTYLFDTEFIYKASKVKGIIIESVSSFVRPELVMSSMGLKVYISELTNLLYILFKA